MRSFLLIALVLITLKGYAQLEIDSLKREDFIADFDLAADIIKKNHPNPYKFISEKDYDRKVDSLRSQLISNPNISNFISCSPLRIIKDVHLSADINKDLFNELFKSLSYFPYPVIIEKGRIFVNIKDQTIPFGSEITDIDGIPVVKVLQMVSLAVDGKNPSMDRVDNFVLSLSMVNGEQKKKYLISFLDPLDMKKKTIEVAAISPSVYFYRNNFAIYPFNLLQTYHGPIYGEFDSEKNIGTITITSFDLGEQYAYKEFSKFFKNANLKKCKKIIIDIRGNGGGAPSIAALLFSFIAKDSFSNVFKFKTNNINLGHRQYRTDDNGRKLSDDDLQHESNFLYQRFDKDSTGRYVGNTRLMEGVVRDFPKDKDAFGGEVKVLVGSQTISAAVYFASLVQKNKRGLIIGKETSSGIDATTAAWFARYELPKTRTSIQIPMSEIYFFDAQNDSGRGLIPDVQLTITEFLDYIKQGKDPELTFATEKE